jgi:hypothetical protein
LTDSAARQTVASGDAPAACARFGYGERIEDQVRPIAKAAGAATQAPTFPAARARTTMSERDDHKAMARSIRGALQAKGIVLTHGECLDLVAGLAGMKGWNVLSAKVGFETPAATGEQCDFCGLPPIAGRRLFSGPVSTICSECVEGCREAGEHRDVVERLGEEGEVDAYLSTKTLPDLERYIAVARRRIADKTAAIVQMDALLEHRSRDDLNLRPGIESIRWTTLAARPNEQVARMRDAQIEQLALSKEALRLAETTLRRRSE